MNLILNGANLFYISNLLKVQYNNLIFLMQLTINI